MNGIRAIFFATAGLCLAGCGGTKTCEKEQSYQEATMGSKIAVPDDLDEPVEYKDLKIPEVSPRESDENRTGCLDEPPKVSTGS